MVRPKDMPSQKGVNCVAHTVQATKDGSFSNFRIVTLFIVNGQVIHLERSQPFATFEALARLEVQINRGIWNLSSRFKDGAYQGLGGEHLDEITTRLSKTDPELLKRIAPAMGAHA